MDNSNIASSAASTSGSQNKRTADGSEDYFDVLSNNFSAINESMKSICSATKKARTEYTRVSSPVPCVSCEELLNSNENDLRELSKVKIELDKVIKENNELKNNLDKQTLELKEANLYITHYKIQMQLALDYQVTEAMLAADVPPITTLCQAFLPQDPTTDQSNTEPTIVELSASESLAVPSTPADQTAAENDSDDSIDIVDERPSVVNNTNGSPRVRNLRMPLFANTGIISALKNVTEQQQPFLNDLIVNTYTTIPEGIKNLFNAWPTLINRNPASRLCLEDLNKLFKDYQLHSFAGIRNQVQHGDRVFNFFWYSGGTYFSRICPVCAIPLLKNGVFNRDTLQAHVSKVEHYFQIRGRGYDKSVTIRFHQRIEYKPPPGKKRLAIGTTPVHKK